MAAAAAAAASSSASNLSQEESESTLDQIISMTQLNRLNSLLIEYTANWSSVSFLIMRPETFAFVIAIFIVFAITHNFETVSALVSSRLNKSQWFKLLKLSSRDSSIKSDMISALFTSGLADVYELKPEPKVAIFGIRGRRGKMEDKFDYINEIQSLGIEMYAVFDGHGSDVSISLFIYLFICLFCFCCLLRIFDSQFAHFSYFFTIYF